MDQFFKHSPLDDATTQIRLLEFQQETTDSIVCSIKEWDTTSAPPYAAISYVWGDPATTSYITLNGKEFGVASNCHYALQQVSDHRESCSAKYYWIDSICIDQQNNSEKSEQVGRMGDTFEDAVEVLACVGPHADDSEIFCDVLHQASWNNDYVDSEIQATAILTTTCTRLWRSYDRVQSVQHFYERFKSAMLALGRRQYWRRLWIVQEIRMARSLVFLCGESAFGIVALVNCLACGMNSKVLSFWHYILMASELEGSPNFMRTVLFMTGHTMPYQQCSYQSTIETTDKQIGFVLTALEKFSAFECSEWRDRLYAMLRVIVWPPDCDSQSIQPDYTVNEYGLFRKFVTCLRPRLIYENRKLQRENVIHLYSTLVNLCEALKLSPSGAEMKRLRDNFELGAMRGADATTLLSTMEDEHVSSFWG